MARLPPLPRPRRAELIEGPDAFREAAALAADIDLAHRQTLNDFNELGRSDNRERHLHIVLVLGIYLVGACCAVMFLVLVAQYILPPRLRLLDEPDTSRLASFLFSGTVGALLSAGASRLKRQSDHEARRDAGDR